MKGLIPAQEVLCIFCGRALETIDHVLISCHLAWRLWCEASQGWGVHLVFPGSLRSLFELWMDIRIGGKFMKKIWESIFYAVVWTIWKVRNNFILHGETVQFDHILHLIKFRVGCWIQL